LFAVLKRAQFAFLSLLCCIWTGSCVSPVPNDETIRLYTRSQEVYREGRFSEAAGMLSVEKNFLPALVLKGKAEYLSGDPAAAEKSLRRVLSLKPQHAEASLFLARLLRENGNKKESQKLIETVLADNPMDLRALRFAAELARERGAPGEAASAVFLDRAVEASAEAALVFLDRARQRWIGGNSSGALEDLGRARALLSQDGPVFNAVEKLESLIREVSS